MAGAQTAEAADLPRSAAGPNSPWLVAVIVSIATFMEVLDTTIANVSLRHIAGTLAAGEDESTYIITSYLVSNAIILPISGWLANVVGRKRFYMICVAIFTLSSVACGFATSLPMMIAFRVLQGIGGGGLAPVEQSIFADSFTPAKRAIAFALYGFTVVTAPAIGPMLGGWLTDNYSWHWVFFINLPVGILSLVLTYFFVYDSPLVKEDRRKLLAKGFRIDYVGFGLVALGFGTLQVVLDRFERGRRLLLALHHRICRDGGDLARRARRLGALGRAAHRQPAPVQEPRLRRQQHRDVLLRLHHHRDDPADSAADAGIVRLRRDHRRV